MPVYRRSAFQIALLLFATGGLYIFVWAFYVRRACAALLEREDQPLWKSVALIIPIFNFFLMFELGARIEGVAWRANPSRSNGSLPWLGVASFIVLLLRRLPGGYSFISLLEFVPLAMMHVAFERGQLALVGEAALPTRLHWIEWIAIVLGSAVFWGLTLIGITLPAGDGTYEPGRWCAWFVLVAAIVALIFIHRASRRARAEGLALHANPPPDAIGLAPFAAVEPGR